MLPTETDAKRERFIDIASAGAVASSILRFDGKALLITGGGSGLGAETARRFAAEGGSVAVCDIDGGAAGRVAAELDGIGVECDVTEEASVRAALARAHERLGRLDCVVTAAGHFHSAPIDEYDVVIWNTMLAVHLTGTFLVCREALPRLREAGGGSIVTFASVTAVIARRHVAAYAAAKGGIVAFSRQLAFDAGADNVRVNVVAPGTVRSPMSEAVYDIPGGHGSLPLPASIVGRIGEPEEIAATVCFLLSDDAGFITGQTVIADGGASAI
jgi:NAD(P)-dependent dehydrogenase (short-subunit alcohol dehydrogenase family)